MKLANAITLSRIPLSLGVIFFWTTPFFSFILYILLCITDLLDGFVARKQQTKSDKGRLLDSSVDYFCSSLIISSFIYLRGELILGATLMMLLFSAGIFYFHRLIKNKKIMGVEFGRPFMSIMVFILISCLIFDFYWKIMLGLTTIFFILNSALFLLGVYDKKER